MNTNTQKNNIANQMIDTLRSLAEGIAAILLAGFLYYFHGEDFFYIIGIFSLVSNIGYFLNGIIFYLGGLFFKSYGAKAENTPETNEEGAKNRRTGKLRALGKFLLLYTAIFILAVIIQHYKGGNFISIFGILYLVYFVLCSIFNLFICTLVLIFKTSQEAKQRTEENTDINTADGNESAVEHPESNDQKAE